MTQTARGGQVAAGRESETAGPADRLAAYRCGRRPSAGAARLMARSAAWYAALSPRGRDIAQDTALALSLAALNLLSLLPYQSHLHPLWLALVLVSGQALPLAVRRICPLPALIACGVFGDVYGAIPFAYAPLPLAPAIAFATVADRSCRPLRWIAVVGTTVGVAWSQVLPGHHQPYDGIVVGLIFATAWTVGTLSRHRRSALAATASRADRAEASLDEAALSAAAAERVRIARELHDVVSHHVSLMAVQAEAVGALLPERPEAAATSADLIGSTARATMAELRRLLGVLRFKDHEDPERPWLTTPGLTPVPSLSRVDELTDAIREAGLKVKLETSGPVAPLPPGVDLTAYRIIQEALTNAVRHAPGASACVRVTYETAHVSVAVMNTGRMPSLTPLVLDGPPGHGYGLAGIAERVASCGGALSLGPTADGGFALTARLPLT